MDRGLPPTAINSYCPLSTAYYFFRNAASDLR